MNGEFIGAFINAFGILTGALWGLALIRPLSVRSEKYIKNALGAFTALFGFWLVWVNVGGTFVGILKQLGIGLLAVMAGHLIGRLLRLQKISNRLGRGASEQLALASKKPPGKPAAGFVAALVLFCVSPLGIIGAVTDGMSGFFYPLVLKAVMDGLAMRTFVQLFRWPVALVALPVCGFLAALTWAVMQMAPAVAASPVTLHPVNAVAGLLLCVTSLVVLAARRVELANYLPALAVMPLLVMWLGY